MFTREDLFLLEELKRDPDYQMIRCCNEYVQYRSRSTGHIFLITKVDFNCYYPYVMYHSHNLNDVLHHHYQTKSLKEALKSFDEHERWVNRVEPMIKKFKNPRYKYE